MSGKLFLELDQFKSKFRRWIAPSLVNLDSLFEEKLNDAQDWDIAFQMAEKTKKDIYDLSRYWWNIFSFLRKTHLFIFNCNFFFNWSRDDDERIGCFVISLSSFQKEVEYISSRYWDALASSLFTSIKMDADKILFFTSNAIALLQSEPNNPEKLSQTATEFNELLRNTPEV